jgi:osmoprotectant transport system permease protein
MTKVHDRVLFLMCCIGLVAAFFGGFLERAPNRLAAGTRLPLLDAPGFEASCAIIGLGLFMPISLIPSNRVRSLATFGAALVLLWASLAAAGHLAADLAEGGKPAMRLSLGPSFWILVGVALLALLDATQRASLGLAARLGLGSLVVGGIAFLAMTGTFDSLSLAKEFASHRVEFLVELRRHLALVGMALLLALAVGIPLVFLVLRHGSLRGLVLSSLGIVQTIPSIALFGVLIAPLSALGGAAPVLKDLGIGGTGAAPAIIALTLYSLFPLVRGFTVGLIEVPPAVKDAAQGLGFDRRRLFLDVELPLALPALLSGLRVVTIQAIGLATVAALIGAGGLGAFVFQGIGQYALDLVLVGAIPVVLLALAADLVFQVSIGATRR